MANILSGNLPHQTGRDMEIAGRQVKKGTIIIPQISVIMCDPIVCRLSDFTGCPKIVEACYCISARKKTFRLKIFVLSIDFRL